MIFARLKLPLFIWSLSGACGLTPTIHAGHTGSPITANISNTMGAGLHLGRGSGKTRYHKVTRYRISPL